MSKKKSSKSKHFRILGYRVRRSRFYAVAGFLLFPPLLFLFVMFAFLLNNTGDGPSSPIIEDQVVEETVEEFENELVALLSRHRNATGLKDIAAMTLYGTYREAGQDYEMALSIRLPGMIRKKLRGNKMEVVLVVTGQAGQLRTSQANGKSQVKAMTEEDLYRYATLLEGGGLRLSEAAEEDYSYELLPVENDTSTRRIVSTSPSGIAITHTIDPDSGMEVQRSIELSDEDESSGLTLYLEDLREVEGVILPYLYRLHINDTETAVIQVQSVQLNPIIPQWFFTLEEQGAAK